MHSHRRPARWWALVLTLTLLFAQWATAAYACASAPADGSDIVAMADMPGCDGHMASPHRPASSSLCKLHCEQGSQSPSTAPDANLSPPVLLLAVLDWAPVGLLPGEPAGHHVAAPSGAPPPGFPPIYLALQVLRH